MPQYFTLIKVHFLPFFKIISCHLYLETLIRKYFINKKNPSIFLSKNVYLIKKVIIISFFIQSQSLFTLFLDPVIQVVKIGIFKIMRHKLCNCLPKLLVKKYLFFVLSNNMSKVLS